MRLLLIRHGETEYNRLRAYCGCRTDAELSEEGIRKLKALSGSFGPVDRLYCGTMKRCRQSAELLFPEIPEAALEGMTEIDFGLWEGKSYPELNGDRAYQAWIDSGGTAAIPGGEDRNAFCKRTMEAFNGLLKDLKSNGKGCRRAALVCHGGNIMAVMSSLDGGDYFDYQLGCGAAYELEFSLKEERICELSYHSLSDGFSA